MTSNDKETILRAARDGDWWKVFKMYKEKRELRTFKILPTGDTVLHMAVSSGEFYFVGLIVDLVCPTKSNGQAADENGSEKKDVFGAKNNKGNTPLHLAASASNGSAELCKKIGGADSSIIITGNNEGETPLFLAALHGNKEAFLWLHYNIPKVSSSRHASYKRHDKDTILHYALAGGHIDVGIEIVHLYKDHIREMTMKCNKSGLSPLHMLAAIPSAFKSTDLPYRCCVVRLLYHFLRVKEKQRATRRTELQVDCEHSVSLSDLADHVYRSIFCGFRPSELVYLGETLPCCIARIWNPIVFLLSGLAWVLAAPLIILKILISPKILISQANNWFSGIRKMKEKHTWSLQILAILLQPPATQSVTTSTSAFQRFLTCPERIVENETGYKIVDAPLIIAAKNGVMEMVETIVFFDAFGMDVLDDEGKDIVLLAAENRQSKLYQSLRGHYYLFKDNTAFRQVDNNGNTALHLAAKAGINLNGQTTTMIEEFKWFEFVKSSVPSALWESYNKEGKTAKEIFRDSYKEHMTRDRKWLDQTSQTCTVASTIVAGMAFSNFAGENFEKKNDASLVALSLSLSSTISFLAILAFRSQSLNFWKYVPFMLHIAILTMFGSIVALWISLFHGQSIRTCAILGSPIVILTIVSLPIFIGPTVMSMFNPVPPPNRNTTNGIQYRRHEKKENEVDKDQKTTPNP